MSDILKGQRLSEGHSEGAVPKDEFKKQQCILQSEFELMDNNKSLFWMGPLPWRSLCFKNIYINHKAKDQTDLEIWRRGEGGKYKILVRTSLW